MTKNQKLAIELLKATRWRYMEKKPKNIEVYTNSGSDFGSSAVIFDEKDGVVTFQIITDEEWYLCTDNKFRTDPALAANYIKDKYVDGVLKKEYPSIINRAYEALGYVAIGMFPKVD